MRQTLAEQRAIRQTGQRVVIGEIAQFLLGALAFGDVVGHADVMRAAPGRVAHFADFDPAQEFLAVLAFLPQLAVPVAAGEERLAHRVVVFLRMLRGIEDGRRPHQHVGFLITEHAREGAIDGDEIEVEIGHADRLAHAVDHFRCDAALAFGQTRRRDVARGAAHAQRLAVFVAFDHFSARQHPDPVVLAIAHAMFDLEKFRCAEDVLVDAAFDERQIFRMHDVAAPFVRADRAFGASAAFARGAQPMDRAAGNVPVPEFVAGTPQRQAQTILALAQFAVVLQLALAALAIGDPQATEQAEQDRDIACLHAAWSPTTADSRADGCSCRRRSRCRCRCCRARRSRSRRRADWCRWRCGACRCRSSPDRNRAGDRRTCCGPARRSRAKRNRSARSAATDRWTIPPAESAMASTRIADGRAGDENRRHVDDRGGSRRDGTGSIHGSRRTRARRRRAERPIRH